MTGFIKITKLDFFIMKSQLLTFLTLAPIIVIFGFMGSSAVVLGIHGAWFSALLVACNIFAIQEKNNLDRLYGSVSVKLEDIVLGRYVFMFLLYFASYIAAMVVYTAFALYRGNALNIFDLIVGFSISFLVFSVVTGTQAPLFFKMGFIKARGWSFIPYSLLMVLLLFPIIPQFVPSLSILADIIERIRSNQSVLIISGILAGCIVLFTSFKISVAVYRKRKRG